MVHARALLTSTPEGRTCYTEEDIRDPERILDNNDLHQTLDLSQPVALLVVAVLHFLPDHDESRAVVQRLVDALAPGSYVIASVATADLLEPAVVAALQTLPDEGKFDITGRTKDEFAQFFDGLELLAPGILPASLWRPDLGPAGEPPPAEPHEASVYAAVGRKP